ncbi:MAG: hypothetical protein RLZZ383_2503 [Pseudomonadota bacterium]|jgi:hypothetical protein
MNSELVVGLVCATIAANRIVPMWRLAWRRPVVFACVQISQIVMAGFLVFRGFPGFEQVPILRFVLVALFLHHVMQNQVSRRAWLSADADAQAATLLRRPRVVIGEERWVYEHEQDASSEAGLASATAEGDEG